MNINLEEKERMNQCLCKNKWNDVDGDDGECDIELQNKECKYRRFFFEQKRKNQNQNDNNIYFFHQRIQNFIRYPHPRKKNGDDDSNKNHYHYNGEKK